MSFTSQAFPATCYVMVFRNAAIKDLFELGLKEMIAQGQLYEIDRKYTTEQISSWDVKYLEKKDQSPCQPAPSQPL
jgi:hypothetical protein